MAVETVIDAPAALAAVARARFEAAARVAMVARGSFVCALPGGSVATAVFPELVRARVDWRRVDFFWGDERAVPPDDPESNHAAARRLWLDHVAADPARVHRLPADAADPEAAAAAYGAELVRAAGDPPRLDLALLGVGPDGHVCSLFPHHPALAETARWVVPVYDAPKPPPRRLTLTLPAVTGAALVCVVAFGAAKAAVIHEATRSAAASTPLARVVQRSAQVLLLLDPGAAGRA
jgi:6-phosphogluconolactonase